MKQKLSLMNETIKSQLRSGIKQNIRDEENQLSFNNVEEYIQCEKKNKFLISNDFLIEEDQEGENEEDDYNVYFDQQLYVQSPLEDIFIEDNSDKITKRKHNKKNGQKKMTSAKEYYLPQINQKHKYTLVLDLDETLIHYHQTQCGGEFLIRPYVQYFLKEMSKYYEIIIFTAALQEYADYILDIIDQDKNISYKLYRHHTIFDGQSCIKDLSKLGRDLSKTIIIDNLPENFSRQPESGIFIQSWYGESEDKALFDLAPLLQQIVEKNYSDVRIALRRFSDLIEENIRNGLQYPHLNLVL